MNYSRAYKKAHGLYIKEGRATTEPIATVTRQQLRRKVIVQRKGKGFPIESGFKVRWAKTGPAWTAKGPTPARRPRPKHHRWLHA